MAKRTFRLPSERTKLSRRSLGFGPLAPMSSTAYAIPAQRPSLSLAAAGHKLQPRADTTAATEPAEMRAWYCETGVDAAYPAPCARHVKMSGLRSTSHVRSGAGALWAGWVSRARPRRPQACCEADLRSGSGRADLIDQASVWVIVGEAPRTVEHGEAAVRVCVNAHRHLDEVAPVALLGDLQHAPRVADRVVVPHHTLLLDAQDVVEHAHERQKGRPRLGGRDREAGVVARDVHGGEPAVGGRDRGEPLLAQERRQPALKGPEQPLHATPALRAVARDVRDAELLERPPDLGEAGLVHRLPGLTGVEVLGGFKGSSQHGLCGLFGGTGPE